MEIWLAQRPERTRPGRDGTSRLGRPLSGPPREPLRDRVRFGNRSEVGAGVIVCSAKPGEGPRFYTVEAGKSLAQTLPLTGRYDLAVYGANGVFRYVRDEAVLIITNGYGPPRASWHARRMRGTNNATPSPRAITGMI